MSRDLNGNCDRASCKYSILQCHWASTVSDSARITIEESHYCISKHQIRRNHYIPSLKIEGKFNFSTPCMATVMFQWQAAVPPSFCRKLYKPWFIFALLDPQFSWFCYDCQISDNILSIHFFTFLLRVELPSDSQTGSLSRVRKRALVYASLGIPVFSADIINYQIVPHSSSCTFVARSEFVDNGMLHPMVWHTCVPAWCKISKQFSFDFRTKKPHVKIQKHLNVDCFRCALDHRALS